MEQWEQELRDKLDKEIKDGMKTTYLGVEISKQQYIDFTVAMQKQEAKITQRSRDRAKKYEESNECFPIGKVIPKDCVGINGKTYTGVALANMSNQEIENL